MMLAQADSMVKPPRRRPTAPKRSGTGTGKGSRGKSTTSTLDRGGTEKRKEAFKVAYEACMCNLTLASEQSGISRRTVHYWRTTDVKFAKELEAIAEVRLDFAENALDKQIKAGSVAAICFFLKCKAKHRGYVERQELTGRDGEALQLLHEELPQKALGAILAKLGMGGK
jgi:maltooligosyltrehalose synthase